MKPVDDPPAAPLATAAKWNPHLPKPSCTADQNAGFRMAGNDVNDGGAFVLRHQSLSLGNIGPRRYNPQERRHGPYAIGVQQSTSAVFINSPRPSAGQPIYRTRAAIPKADEVLRAARACPCI